MDSLINVPRYIRSTQKRHGIVLEIEQHQMEFHRSKSHRTKIQFTLIGCVDDTAGCIRHPAR